MFCASVVAFGVANNNNAALQLAVIWTQSLRSVYAGIE